MSRYLGTNSSDVKVLSSPDVNLPYPVRFYVTGVSGNGNYDATDAVEAEGSGTQENSDFDFAPARTSDGLIQVSDDGVLNDDASGRFYLPAAQNIVTVTVKGCYLVYGSGSTGVLMSDQSEPYWRLDFDWSVFNLTSYTETLLTDLESTWEGQPTQFNPTGNDPAQVWKLIPFKLESSVTIAHTGWVNVEGTLTPKKRDAIYRTGYIDPVLYVDVVPVMTPAA